MWERVYSKFMPEAFGSIYSKLSNGSLHSFAALFIRCSLDKTENFSKANDFYDFSKRVDTYTFFQDMSARKKANEKKQLNTTINILRVSKQISSRLQYTGCFIKAHRNVGSTAIIIMEGRRQGLKVQFGFQSAHVRSYSHVCLPSLFNRSVHVLVGRAQYKRAERNLELKNKGLNSG